MTRRTLVSSVSNWLAISPPTIATPKGRRVVLHGKIDRVDLVEGGAQFAVIDYKLTGRPLALLWSLLATTPSVLSRAIARLEKRLGTQLLRRTTRSMGLTEAGRQYVDEASAAFALIDKAERAIQGGQPFLQRYLSFWVANLVERMWLALGIIMAVLLPLSRVVPPLYQFRIRSRVFRWYGQLRILENAARILPAYVPHGAAAVAKMRVRTTPILSTMMRKRAIAARAHTVSAPCQDRSGSRAVPSASWTPRPPRTGPRRSGPRRTFSIDSCRSVMVICFWLRRAARVAPSLFRFYSSAPEKPKPSRAQW